MWTPSSSSKSAKQKLKQRQQQKRGKRKLSETTTTDGTVLTLPTVKEAKVTKTRKRITFRSKNDENDENSENSGSEDEEETCSETKLFPIFMKPGRKVSGSRLELRSDDDSDDNESDSDENDDNDEKVCTKVCYVTKRGEIIEIPFSNIRMAFFQCATNIVTSNKAAKTTSTNVRNEEYQQRTVLIQFWLKQPVMIGQKAHHHLQFFSPPVTRLDYEEINEQFSKFVQRLEQDSELSVETSDDQLRFSALCHRSMATFASTPNCLVSFSNYPFLVVLNSEIEVVSLDRLRNEGSFDMIIVPRKSSTTTSYLDHFKMIESIPIEYVDAIRRWIANRGIIHFESAYQTNWKKLLREIENEEGWDPWGAIGWHYLLGPEEDEEVEDEDEGSENDRTSAKPGNGILGAAADDDDDDDEDDYQPTDDESDYGSPTPKKKKQKKSNMEESFVKESPAVRRLRTPSKRIANRMAINVD